MYKYMNNQIPKIIHQIWIGNNKKPDVWMNTFKIDYIEKNPHYQYKLWNDENIIELLDKYPKIKFIYNLEDTYNGKSDILRYLILYENGGIYIDADSVWINDRSFDYLTDNCNTGMFAAIEPNTTHITGGVIGSNKFNVLLQRIINHIEEFTIVNNNFNRHKYLRMRHIHGPSNIIGPLLFNKYTKDENITIYPSHYFYPISWYGIKTIDAHKTLDLPKDSFMFQYGYTTNNLKQFFN